MWLHKVRFGPCVDAIPRTCLNQKACTFSVRLGGLRVGTFVVVAMRKTVWVGFTFSCCNSENAASEATTVPLNPTQRYKWEYDTV